MQPQHLQHGALLKQNAMFYPQVAYPMMANTMPSERTHGVFSSYPARLKHSDDNALLLPESYVNNKRTRFTESEDEFEASEEEDQDDDDASRATAKPSEKLKSPPKQLLPKIIRKKNHLDYQLTDLHLLARMEEILVPIRLDIDVDSIKLRDRFLWNMNEQILTPEKFAEMMCEDLELSTPRFVKPIADSIRTQVLDFESINDVQLPDPYLRVTIDLDLQIGKVNFRDQFEWELGSETSNMPEIFSKQLAAELGLGGEYPGIIAHAIREQLFFKKKQYVEELTIENEHHTPLENGYRLTEEASRWEPRMDMLSNDELEKLLIAQERNIRRMRRETRFKRSRRHRANDSS